LKHGTTVSEFAERVLDLKRKAKKSNVHLNGLKMYFRTFCDSFGDRPIASITTEELDDWLSALPANRASYRRHISVLFGVAKKRKIITANPISDTETPGKNDDAPEIFAVDELQTLLETAQRTQPDILPLIAIGAFAGLRSDVKDSEIARLDWSEVNQERGFIEVKARKAKTARRRLVSIQPNLAEWLQPYASMTGPVLPKGARRKLEAVRKGSGVTWKRNGLRHSFASYRLAATNDAPKVAAELGHPNPTLLYNTYRELVHPDEAARYWKIAPAAEAGNLVAFVS
jgi:integrase